MRKLILTLSLASLAACAQASTETNKYYILDSSGEYPVITEVSKQEACDFKAAPRVSDYKPAVVSLIKDKCSNAKIPPNVVVMIQERKLHLAAVTEKQ
ncbi:MAG: hypothetical protein ACH34X_11270 [Thiolinea sp.]